MLTAAAIASFLHATIAAYVARALLDGAATEQRRRLGWSFVLFTAYSLAIGFGYSMKPYPHISENAFAACVAFGIGSSLQFTEIARAIVWGERGARLSRILRWITIAIVTLAFVAHVVTNLTTGNSGPAYGVLAFFSLVAVLVGLSFCIAGARRHPLSRALMFACICPLIPATMDLADALTGAPIPFYRYVRDLSLLLYCFLALIAYMDHGAERMSLRRRFLAGLLTSVLAVVTCSAEWAISRVHGATPDETAVMVHHMALGFALLGALATLVTLVVFPRMVRRSVLVPLDRLAAAARTIESGNTARVEVEHEDELGETARAFNQMVDALATNRQTLVEQVDTLEKRNTEVASLNAELRRQVAARSRQLQDAIRELEGPKSLLRAGALVAGRYRVVREIGGGGMGIVFEVDDEIEKRKLALKVISGATSRDDVVRFAREAEIAASVHHANVVPVIDVGVHEGTPFLVMELVTGGSLEASRARFGDVPRALTIVAQVAAALAELHARGVVHRDLKPANILLEERDGKLIARVTDFGIARHDVDVFAATSALGEGAASVTATGVVIGTLPYMAPEAARGIREASGKLDVFALGLIAHELLTGNYPFALPPILEAMAGRPLPARAPLPEGLTPRVRTVLEACLSLQPDERPTATEIATALAS
jgi:HAMP domain-containing protein